MKKILVVLLAMGFVMAAFGSAMAVTADFTGEYYVRGYYINNNSLADQDKGEHRGSLSYVDQRLRMFPKLKIADGLTLTMRFDALETVWGIDQQPGSLSNATSASAQRDWNSPNISIERVYVDFKTGIGDFRVGYQSGTPYSWGTSFMNAPGTVPGVKWSNKFGDLTVLADWFKQKKGDWNFTADAMAIPNYDKSDYDRDYYDLGIVYKTKALDAGLLWTYFRRADKTGTAPADYVRKVHFIQPYAKFKVGALDLEAEGYLGYGKDERNAPSATKPDVDYRAKGLYVKGKYNLGPAYVGAMFVYASGDDTSTIDKMEGGVNSTFGYGSDSSGIFVGDVAPAILFGYWYNNYITLGENGPGNSLGANIDNVWMYSLFAGFTPVKKIDLFARYTYAKADEITASANADKPYGSELDVQATYKIYDQLTYNIGAAYLWTGDYFKKPGGEDVKNNYMLMHWIDLNF